MLSEKYNSFTVSLFYCAANGETSSESKSFQAVATQGLLHRGMQFNGIAAVYVIVIV